MAVNSDGKSDLLENKYFWPKCGSALFVSVVVVILAFGLPLNPRPGSKSCKLTPSDELGPFYVKKEYTLETKCIAFSRNNSNPGTCNDREHTREPVTIQGKILDSNCEPVDGAILEYWQAAPEFSESHSRAYTMVESSCTGMDTKLPQMDDNCIDTILHVEECKKAGIAPDCIRDMEYKAYRGWQVATNGDYEIKTVRPGIYDIRPIRHIHIKITVPGQKIEGKDSLVTQLYLPQDEPTENTNIILKHQKISNLYDYYIFNCEYYRIKPGQWAKKQQLEMCPVRKEPEGSATTQETIYYWDAVVDIGRG